MPNSILLVGFEKSIVSSLTSLFPEVTIKTTPPDFSYDDFRCYCGGTHSIFINGEPSVFLNLIKGKSYIRYPGSGMISYHGDTILNLHSIWELFIERQIFVFGLPNALHLNSLGKIADITGTKVEIQPSMDSVSLDIKVEHKDYLAGFIFAQLFSFLPEFFTHEEPQCGTIKNDECFRRSNALLNSVHLKLKAVKPDHDLSSQGLRSLIDNISEIARQVKNEAEDIDLLVFGRERFNGVEEVKLDNNHPLAHLYPEYIDHLQHWWLRRTPSILKPLMQYEYLMEHRDHPVRQIHNPRYAPGSSVFLLPPPESMEDVLLPISAILADLTKKSQNTNAAAGLRELYKRRFSNKPFSIIGGSAAMELLYRQIIPVLGDKNGHVLIMGEAGTGKELVADIIMKWSKESSNSMNCAHLSPELAHGALFGYVKGAFTGADKNTPGYISENNKGYLFMDEIEALSEKVMPMLLRYLECGEFQTLGDPVTRRSSVKIIGASNDDTMLQGKFLHRGFISRFRYVIRVPSLKYRRSDIPLLVQHFVAMAKRDLDILPNVTIFPEQIETLQDNDWQHSNVRGLKNAVYNLLARGTQSTTSSDIRSTMADKSTHTEMKTDLPDQGTSRRGPKEKISDKQLLDYLTKANDADDLRKKLCGNYQTKSAMWQRINRSGNSEELKRLFDQDKFKDYPRCRR